MVRISQQITEGNSERVDIFAQISLKGLFIQEAIPVIPSYVINGDVAQLSALPNDIVTSWTKIVNRDRNKCVVKDRSRQNTSRTSPRIGK